MLFVAMEQNRTFQAGVKLLVDMALAWTEYWQDIMDPYLNQGDSDDD